MAVLTCPEIKTEAPAVTRLALVVEYNGARYSGFQLQAGLPTIQSELEAALHKLTGERIRVSAASRTDTGVHAQGQVVSFHTTSLLPPETFVNGLNYHLPDDIAIKSASIVDSFFKVRNHAVSRSYRYQILNSSSRSPMRDDFVFQVPGDLDVAEMDKAARLLIGRHDFASFTTVAGIITIRLVHTASVKRDGDLVIFDITANAFLPHQIRNTAGALLKVGRGRMDVEEFQNIIDAAQTGLAGPTAPALGLCLLQVNYAEGILNENI